MRRPVMIALATAAAFAPVSCNDDSGREGVEAYIRDANRIQREAAPDFKRSDKAYTAFARGELGEQRAVRDLARAREDIGAAREEITELEPPDDARVLHERLLRVFDINVDFAGETADLARYQQAAAKVLGPLGRDNRALRKALAVATDPPAQAVALGNFAAALRRTLKRLRGLRPPELLAPLHRGQVDRLSATSDVAGQLQEALLAGDADRVAQLLIRFREGAGGPRRGLTRKAVARYNRRYRRLDQARAAMQREFVRLDRELD